MNAPKGFVDTNIFLYLLSDDTSKANRAEQILQNRGVISVQVLNEIGSVTRRKFGMSWHKVNEILALAKSLCSVESLTVKTHEKGIDIAERYGLSIYDSMIVSAAILSQCEILYSEDMQDGMIIDDKLSIRNPF